jgi:hypothetical protein
MDAFNAPVGRRGVMQNDVAPVPRRNARLPRIDRQCRRPVWIETAVDGGLRFARWQQGRTTDHAGSCRFNVGWKRCRRHPSWLKATQHQCAWCCQPKDPSPPERQRRLPTLGICRSFGPAERQIHCRDGLGAGLYRDQKTVSTRTPPRPVVTSRSGSSEAKTHRDRSNLAQAHGDAARIVSPVFRVLRAAPVKRGT